MAKGIPTPARPTVTALATTGPGTATALRLGEWGKRHKASRIVVYSLAEDGTRQDVMCTYDIPSKPADGELEAVWHAIAMDARSEAQALGTVRLYLAVGEAPGGTELPGGVKWRETGNGRLEPPTITGAFGQQMRHNEAMAQQAMLREATTFRILAEENQRTRKENVRLRKRIRNLEKDRDSVVAERETLLSQKADRIAARKLAADKAEQTRDLIGQAKIVMPMIGKAIASKMGIKDLPFAASASMEAIMTKGFMESLGEAQFHAILKQLNPVQAQFFIKAYESFRDEQDKADEETPDIEADTDDPADNATDKAPNGAT